MSDPSAVPSPARCASWHIEPCGERCLIVAFDDAPDAAEPLYDTNRRARAAAAQIRAAALAGVSDVVPALASVGVHYDPVALARWSAQGQAAQAGAAGRAPHAVLAEALHGILAQAVPALAASGRIVPIPVCYGGEYGPDLQAVAMLCGMSHAEVIALHSAAPVDVLMLGFAPGHPYVGAFDARLAPPRRATPRTAVAAGSIGLANRQCVIYPMTMPGGWNLIGRTPLAMFDPAAPQPCLVSAGDQVHFVPIGAAEFEALQAQGRMS